MTKGTLGIATSYPFADLDLDGDVDATDLSTLQTNRAAGLTPTELTYSGLDNPYMFTGRETDTWHASSIYVSVDANYHRNQWNRNRNYGPRHGRWRERDPLGLRPDAPRAAIDPHKQYTDGMNVYEYVKSQPTSYMDPDGSIVVAPFIPLAIKVAGIAGAGYNGILACYYCGAWHDCHWRAVEKARDAAKRLDDWIAREGDPRKQAERIGSAKRHMINSAFGKECAQLAARCGRKAVNTASFITGRYLSLKMYYQIVH